MASPAHDPASAASAVFFLIGFVFILGLFLIPFILYLLSMQKAVNRVAPERRAMSPGHVWLIFIPFYNLYWQFAMVSGICSSLRNEFEARGITGEENYGKTIGLTMCILNCCSIIPFIGVLAGLVAFILWIIWWVKIAGFSAKIALPASV